MKLTLENLELVFKSRSSRARFLGIGFLRRTKFNLKEKKSHFAVLREKVFIFVIFSFLWGKVLIELRIFEALTLQILIKI